MEFMKNKSYQALLQKIIEEFPYWSELEGKSFCISGASGMIGSLLIDLIMMRNTQINLKKRNRIIAISRSQKEAERRFACWIDKEEFNFYSHDITNEIDFLTDIPDILIHAASTTHPIQYISEPINTIFANVFGTKNMLDLAAKKKNTRFLLLSSVEIYGENRGDVDCFDECYCGYIDCNTLRAGYPEAKRISETLCQAYIKEKNIDSVIIRLPRCYGPTMRMTDTKAIAQFIKNGIAKEDIVLKSSGEQYYSYAFVGDVVSGMLYVLVCGKNGEAYNLADNNSNITLKDLAVLIAKNAQTNTTFELPSEEERKGYSTATNAVLKSTKLQKLGWSAQYSIEVGIQMTMEMLKNENNSGIE